MVCSQGRLLRLSRTSQQRPLTLHLLPVRLRLLQMLQQARTKLPLNRRLCLPWLLKAKMQLQRLRTPKRLKTLQHQSRLQPSSRSLRPLMRLFTRLFRPSLCRSPFRRLLLSQKMLFLSRKRLLLRRLRLAVHAKFSLPRSTVKPQRARSGTHCAIRHPDYSQVTHRSLRRLLMETRRLCGFVLVASRI